MCFCKFTWNSAIIMGLFFVVASDVAMLFAPPLPDD